jgi:hypothetical protein
MVYERPYGFIHRITQKERFVVKIDFEIHG